MSELTLPGSPWSFLTNFSAFGLAAILEDELGTTARVWHRTLDAITVSLDDATIMPEEMAAAVHRHASQRLESWVTLTHDHKGSKSGTMSPRLKPAGDADTWRTLQAARWVAFDGTGAPRRGWLDAMFMGALGEPAYWYINNKGENEPDRGASGWEMKTRNRGEEFVQNRLALLCAAVAQRTVQQVLDGLTGRSPKDEVGSDSPSSRTPTGLSAPAPTDNAVAWCALWGISLFPVVHNATAGVGTSKGGGRQSMTAGVIRGLPQAERLVRAVTYLPLFKVPTRLARVRTIAVSGALARVAARESLRASSATWTPKERERWEQVMLSLTLPSDDDQLRRRGCTAVLVGQIKVTDNINAPEPHVVEGRPVILAEEWS